MSSLLARAKEKAQEAAQHLSQSSSQPHPSSSGGSAGSGAGAGGGGLAPSTYTSSLPHLLRHGIASFDPRLQANRSFHVLNTSVKAVSIDHEALNRETHALARAAYGYGQDHIASQRSDGVGDEVIVDIMDRIAYVLSLTGDLQGEHVARIEAARKTFKSTVNSSPAESPELLNRRSKRAAIVKELHTLMPERAKATPSAKVKELEDALRKLEQEDKAAEEAAAIAKRQAVRTEWTSYFDSVIQLGEQLALAARYGKLIAQQVPTSPSVDPVHFPADKTVLDRTKTPTWSGAVRVAEIRAAVGPAVKQLQVDKETLPHVPAASDPFSDTSTVAGTGAAASLARSDTVSFGVSHAAELRAAASEQGSALGGHERIHLSDEGPAAHLAAPSGGTSPGQAQVYGSSPSGGYGPLSSRINMAPIDIPSSPVHSDPYRRRASSFNRDSPPPVPGRPVQHPPHQERHRVPPLPGDMHVGSPGNLSHSPSSSSRLAYGVPGHDRHPSPGEDLSSPMTAPDEPTVAETGAPIIGQGGPKTGYLPRRKSSVVPPATGPSSSAIAGPSSGAATLAAPNYYETTAEARARKEAEAERERQAAAAAAAAESSRTGGEQLPPYTG